MSAMGGKLPLSEVGRSVLEHGGYLAPYLRAAQMSLCMRVALVAEAPSYVLDGDALGSDLERSLNDIHSLHCSECIPWPWNSK